jgi:large conductance mechanosensitive channel
MPNQNPNQTSILGYEARAARNLWQEFKGFALKGNMLDLAVAVIVGAAFGQVINSLVQDLIMPAISYIKPEAMEYTKWHIGTDEKPILIGKFLGTLVNFFIVSASVFAIVVKILGTVIRKVAAPAPATPTTKECPRCLSAIPIRATKCAHCTADLPAE